MDEFSFTNNRAERKGWLVLEGTVGHDGKPVAAIGEAQLKVLRATRDEVDAELLALDGAPSVSAALRALRESSGSDAPAPAGAVRAAAEILLTYVVNALRDPRDPRVHRVHAGNPTFQRALGRLGGCEGAMMAVGFEPQDRGTIFVLRVGSRSAAMEKKEVGTAHFRFPALDPITEAFLWRRKVDLEAAIEAMPSTAIIASAEAPQGARGRAAEDLNDARILAGDDFVRGVKAEGLQVKRCATAIELANREFNRTEHEKHDKLGISRGGMPRSSRGRTRGNGTAGEGAATTMALSVTSGGSKAMAGARDLQLTLIKESFARLDLDGDGFITPNDLRSAFRNIGRDASDRSVYAWIRRRDIRQDGRVSLDEFVASFEALMPPDTAGWAAAAAGHRFVKQTSRAKATRGVSEIYDAKGIANDDGASAVAAAFGRIRLSGSPSECRAAAEYVLDYCRRVRDSPSVPLHWRIPLASKRFASAIGKLTGGIELMQAVGLRLEENGTVLALREDGCASGAKWNCVPENMLQRLDNAAKELTAQMRGIDHLEVADLAAVSAAVARLRNTAGNAGPHLRCIEAAAKYLGNVLEHPSTGKYRRINTSNPIFLRDVVSVQGGMQLMVALGFREDVDGQLLLPMDANLTHLAARKLELDSGLPFLRAAAAASECETKAPNAGSGSKIQPTSGSAVEGGRGREASAISRTSRQRDTTQAAKSRLLPRASQSGSEQGDRKLLARGKSESPERSAAAEGRRMQQSLKIEARSQREAKAALLKHRGEIEKLQREIAAYKEKEASSLPVRDALTIARMDEQERASVALLASKMGLDMTKATEALIWAENVKKRPTLTAPSETIPGENVGRAAASASGRERSGLRKRTWDLIATELVLAAAAGHALLEVARPEIVRAGCKVILGSGGGQEGRFVTAVVDAAEAGDGRTEGYGGIIVLETSIARDHPKGARVIPVRPGRAEAESYRKRRVVSMVLDSLLRPIIDDAVRLGERVLTARATQSAFERRAVPKYAFTVAPACVGRIRAIPEGGDDGYTNRGIAVLPELGKVVSVVGKSTLVCHQETLSLIYLRRSFLAIGHSALRGKITSQEFRTELRSNPILAAGLSCTCGEQVTGGAPGDRALREIHRRRHRSALGDVQSRGDDAKEVDRQAETDPPETLTWPEFVGVFLPLKCWEWDKRAAMHRDKTKDDAEQCSPADDGGWDAGLLPDADDEEKELLQVAFAVRASGVQGRSNGGTATLAELRGASAELDGVVPPEEPIRKALRTATSGNGRQTSNEARGQDSYSFKDFVLLRAILARDAVPGGGGGAGFAAGWKLSALMHLRRVFLKVFDTSFVSGTHADLEYYDSRAVDEGHNFLDSRCSSLPVDSAVEINAKDFVSEALKEPAVVRFLGMCTGGCWRRQVASSEDLNPTLRAAMHDLATGRPAGTDTATTVTRSRAGTALTAAREQQEEWNTVRWEDVEGLLFEPLDPAVVVSGPPLTTSAVLRTPLPAGMAEETVAELATDAEAGFIYVLMADGEVKVYDAAGPIGGGGVRRPGCEGGGPLWTCQLITHEPSPRALGSEGWREYTRWHEAVGLDGPLMSNTTEGRSAADVPARHQCKDGARRLLRLRPCARILHPCPGTGLILVNSSAGDRCVRFHDTGSLRRICRTRLDLPPPPRSSLTDGQGLFDALAVSGARLGKVASGSRGEGTVAARDRDEIGTTECSLVDLAFLPMSSTLIGLIGGRAEVQAFCSDTGLVLAIFAGHALIVNCMLWVPSQLILVTGSADSTARVWDVGEDFVPHADEWTMIKNSVINHSSGDATRCGRYYAADNIAALEDAVIASVRGESTTPPVEAEYRPAVNESTAEEASKGQLPDVIRSLRPELLRQARARPVWRTARVTAVLDRTRLGLTLAPAPGAPRAGSKKSRHHPLIEVTYDDGEVQVGVEPYRLRSLEEMKHRAEGGDEQATGPDWERQAVRPAVGVEVAVFGYSERDVCELVADRIQGGAIRESYDAIGALNPAPFSEAGILASLKEIRERAALAAAAGEKCSGDNISSPIALDAALDAAEVTDNGLRKLSGALAAVWKSSFSRIYSPSVAAAEWRRRVAWFAVARALVCPQWSAPAIPGARDEMAASRDSRKSNFQLCQWRKLRLVIPCKFLLSDDGGSNDGVAQVSSLEYLPLARLLATGHSDGRVHLWDPCARKHRLAPPPSHYGGKRFSGNYEDEQDGGSGGQGDNADQAHARIWPGFYANTAEEWTKTGRTFELVAEFDAAASATIQKAKSKGRADHSSGPSGSVRVSTLSAIVIPGGGGPSLIVCDIEGAQAARALDEDSWNIASSGNGGGVFYLTHTGEVLALPCPQGFEEGYVLLDDASFFEVYAPLDAQDHVQAALYRRVFRARSGVLRVIYAASVGWPAIEAIARRMNDTGVAARARRDLDAHFSGRRFAMFYRDGDGSERDITEQISSTAIINVASIAFGGGGSSSGPIDGAHSFPPGDRCAAFASGAVTSADLISPDCSAEFLRVEVGGSGPRTKSATSTPMISAWVVGRVSLRVEARSFDEELGENHQAVAKDAFMGAWALRMQYLRALCSARTEAARDRANAEARVMAHMGEGLRLCSLDRAGGEQAETSVGTKALVQAVATALRLPSRFPATSDHHRRGTYFQAAKVMRSLVRAEDGLRERGLRGSCQAQDLLNMLKRSASSPLDNLARHFLGAALTPALEDGIVGIPDAGHRVAERPIRWSDLRAALDATIELDKATTEEAFILLVRFGQLSASGGELEKFAKRAKEFVSSSCSHLRHSKVNPSAAGASADDEPLKAIPDAANSKEHGSSAMARKKNDQGAKRWCEVSASEEGSQNEASSVLLRPSDVADLAVKVDPLGQVEGALAALKNTLRAGLFASGRRFSIRSPLQSYAATRRFLRWRECLVATGDGLRVAKLKVGRRCQDLLLTDSGHATTAIPFGLGIKPAVTAAELVAEANELMATAARRQTAASGREDDFRQILAARVNSYARLPDRSTKDVRCVDGWGFYEYAAGLGGERGTLRFKKEGANGANGDVGEPVAVLEIPAEQARETVNALQGGTTSFGDNIVFIASLLSVPALREQPGLINFHPGARVVLGENVTPSSGDGDRAAGGSSVHVVCERLQGWKSLREVVRQRGPLVSLTGENEGLRVLRMFGRQLTAVLECLGSRSLVLRDLRASTVFVSPDGRNLKVIAFSSLATLEPTGTVSPGAAPLDPEVHGPTQPLTPPEGFTTSTKVVSSSRCKSNKEAAVFPCINDDDDGIALVLTGGERPGAFSATAAWDVWTLGILLFELAFGHPPPAYGVALNHAVNSSGNVAEAKGVPMARIDDLALTVQYDFLSSVVEQVVRPQRQGFGGDSSSALEPVPALAFALRSMSLGSALGVRSPNRGSTVELRSRALLAGQDNEAGQGERMVEILRQAWIKRQLHMEERGDVDVSTWQEFQDKIKQHLDVSIASAPPLLGRSRFSTTVGGAGRRVRRANADFCGTATDMTTLTVTRTMARLREEDARENERLPFRVVQRVLLDELQLSLSKSEAEILAACLKEGAPNAGGKRNSAKTGLDMTEDEVFYSPLEHIFRASVPSLVEARVSRPFASSPPPSRTSFIEVLCLCLEPDPRRRPSPYDLLRLPFFSSSGCDSRYEEQMDRAAAASYLAGSGNGESSLLILREHVLRPVQAVEDAVVGLPEHTTSRNGTSVDLVYPLPGERTGGFEFPAPFDVGALMGALKEIQRLVCGGYCTFPDEDPSRARQAALDHARIMDEIFESGVLVKASAIGLRFLEQEEAEKTGRGVAGTGFVEGDPSKTIGARILLALARVLEEFLKDLRRADSPILPHTDVVLRCLVSLFLGEEGFIAVKYGTIGPSPLRAGPIAHFPATSTISCEPGLSHWRPAVSQIFEGVLVEAVGETGEGGSAYPVVQWYLRRCAQKAHLWKPSTIGGNGTEEDSDDDSRVGSDGDDEDSNYDCGGGGDHYRRKNPVEYDDGGDWASSSEEEDNRHPSINNSEKLPHQSNSMPRVRRGGRDLVPSQRPHRFARAPLYFSELLVLNRILCTIHRKPRTIGGGGSISAPDLSRRKASAYCLAVVRMCCEMDGEGLDHDEPAKWVVGRDIDEDAATLQRAQLLVDIRLAEKLAPCLHDPDYDIRSNAVRCALSALRGNHARLRWISLSDQVRGGVDPRAILALGFCTLVWVSGFGAMIRDRSDPFRGSRNASRAGRESEECSRIAALYCLRYMATAGDVAIHSWRGACVLPAFQGILSRDSSRKKMTAASDNMARNVSGGAGPSGLEFKGWKEGVLEVMRTLAENGSMETHSLLRSQPTLTQGLKGYDLFSTEGLTPKGVATKSIELLAGGTLEELIYVIRRARSILATALAANDRGVLGSNDKVPRDVGVIISLIWGWMQRALVQLLRDDSDHPSTAARVSLVWECLELVRFLLSSASTTACRLVQSEVHPDVAVGDVSCTSGPPFSADNMGHGGSDAYAHKRDCGPLKLQLGTARTGLETVALLLSVEEPIPLNLYRAHPISLLTAGAADTLGDALSYGDPATIDCLESYGLGLRLGLSVEASARHIRESRRLGVEDIHLLRTYPTGRRARVKLLDRVLFRSHRGLQEQVVVSGLVEFLVRDMLSDCETTEVVNARLPASFVPHNGTPLVRNEGLDLVERVIARRRRSPAVAREMARQAVRHTLSAAECGRLRRFHLRSIRVGVGVCLRCLARLDNVSVDNALTIAGVPHGAITSTRRKYAASKTRRRWARWLRREASMASPSSTVNELPSRGKCNKSTSFMWDKKSCSDLKQGVGDGQGVGGSDNGQTGSSAPWASHDCERSARLEQSLEDTAMKKADRSAASIRQGFPSPITANQSVIFGSSDLGSANALNTATHEKRMRAMLTIEGALPNLSISDVLELLATDLGTTRDVINVVEVSGRSSTGERATVPSFSLTDPAAGTTAIATSHESTLVISLPETLANRLYTRCLAGVLRVPGLLSLKVEGKGRLTWNGEEIVSEDRPLSNGAISLADSEPVRAPNRAALWAPTPNEPGMIPAPAPEQKMEASRGATIFTPTRSRSAVRFSSLALSDAKDTSTDDLSTTRSIPDKRSQTDHAVLRGWQSIPAQGGMVLNTQPKEDPSAKMVGYSVNEKRGRVAAALDRMGAGVVEVREAFQHRLPLQLQAADAELDPTDIRSTSTLGRRGTRQKTSEEPCSAVKGPEKKAEEVDVEDAMVRAMTDLRLPEKIARKNCSGVWATSAATGIPSFSDFIERYSKGAGLFKEPIDDKRVQLWVEGPGGIWVAVSPEEMASARAAFDEQITNRGEETKSEEGAGLGLEDSLGKSETVLALKRIFPDMVSTEAMEELLEKRRHVIDGLFGGRVSFQEFVRAVLHLAPVLRLDAGTTPSPWTSGHRSVPFDTGDTCAHSPRSPGSYFDGMPGRVLGDGKSTAQGSAPCLPKESLSTSPITIGRDRRHDIATQGTRAQDSGWSSRGPVTSAASLRLDRDFKEERRKWAQAVEAGGIPPVHSREISGQNAAAAKSAHSPDTGPGKGIREGRRRDTQNEHLQRGRPRSADHAMPAFAGKRGRSTSIEDPVSRAFEMYAMDRDRDRKRDHERGRLEHPPPLSTRASETDKSARLLSYTIPPRVRSREPPPVSSPKVTHRHEYGGASEFQAPGRQRSAPASSPRPSLHSEIARSGEFLDGARTYSSAEDDFSEPLGRRRYGGSGSRGDFSGFNESGGRSRAFGSSLTSDLRRRGRDHDDTTSQGTNEADNNGSVGEGVEVKDLKELVSESKRQRALRRAFDAYDLNGDGFITYLEIKAVFEQRGLDASDAEVRNWINQRDRSGTGAVDFEDFSRAFVFLSS